MSVIIFNDRYSTNVGDGLLAESLLFHLNDLLPQMNIVGLDVDGKESFPVPLHGAGTSWKKRIPIPFRLRRFLRCRSAYKRILSHIEKATLNSATPIQAFVIGGGQLITATSDYFPSRLLAIMDYSEANNIPVYIQSVGVSNSETWNPNDGAMLLKAFKNRKNLRRAAVRDERSQMFWNSHFPEKPADLCLDPGIIADLAFHKNVQRKENLVGIGVMTPQVAKAIMKSGSWIGLNFYADLYRLLKKKGYVVKFFTNGDLEDEEFLDAIVTDINEPEILRAPRPLDPQMLMDSVSECSAIIAQRMHANIAAYALNIPSVGLGWDPKLESFFSLAKQDQFFLPAANCTAESAAMLISDALTKGLNIGVRETLRTQARKDIEKLAHSITQN